MTHAWSHARKTSRAAMRARCFVKITQAVIFTTHINARRNANGHVQNAAEEAVLTNVLLNVSLVR